MGDVRFIFDAGLLQGMKPAFSVIFVAAELKSCPDTKRAIEKISTSP
jgi:hypothetical protein